MLRFRVVSLNRFQVVSMSVFSNLNVITHELSTPEGFCNLYENGFFILEKICVQAEFPWYVIDELFNRILELDSTDSSGTLFTKTLFSDKEIPDFYKPELLEVNLEAHPTELYQLKQRRTYCVFHMLKEQGVCTKTILSGAVKMVPFPGY